MASFVQTCPPAPKIHTYIGALLYRRPSAVHLIYAISLVASLKIRKMLLLLSVWNTACLLRHLAVVVTVISIFCAKMDTQWHEKEIISPCLYFLLQIYCHSLFNSLWILYFHFDALDIYTFVSLHKTFSPSYSFIYLQLIGRTIL